MPEVIREFVFRNNFKGVKFKKKSPCIDWGRGLSQPLLALQGLFQRLYGLQFSSRQGLAPDQLLGPEEEPLKPGGSGLKIKQVLLQTLVIFIRAIFFS